MDNKQANSPLGIASRRLAFALMAISDREYSPLNFKKIDNLQEGLYEYGKAIIMKARD